MSPTDRILRACFWFSYLRSAGCCCLQPCLDSSNTVRSYVWAHSWKPQKIETRKKNEMKDPRSKSKNPRTPFVFFMLKNLTRCQNSPPTISINRIRRIGAALLFSCTRSLKCRWNWSPSHLSKAEEVTYAVCRHKDRWCSSGEAREKYGAAPMRRMRLMGLLEENFGSGLNFQTKGVRGFLDLDLGSIISFFFLVSIFCGFQLWAHTYERTVFEESRQGCRQQQLADRR